MSVFLDKVFSLAAEDGDEVREASSLSLSGTTTISWSSSDSSSSAISGICSAGGPPPEASKHRPFTSTRNANVIDSALRLNVMAAIHLTYHGEMISMVGVKHFGAPGEHKNSLELTERRNCGVHWNHPCSVRAPKMNKGVSNHWLGPPAVTEQLANRRLALEGAYFNLV